MKKCYRVYYHMTVKRFYTDMREELIGFRVIEALSEVEAKEKIESDYRPFPVTIRKVIPISDSVPYLYIELRLIINNKEIVEAFKLYGKSQEHYTLHLCPSYKGKSLASR